MRVNTAGQCDGVGFRLGLVKGLRFRAKYLGGILPKLARWGEVATSEALDLSCATP